MLRNFDLPEALIFYGLDTVIDSSSSTASSSASSPPPPSIRPGVLRLIEEAKDVGVCTIILSEHLTADALAHAIESIDPSFRQLSNDQIVHYRSSREEFIVDENDMDMDMNSYVPYRFLGQGMGYAPCPAALYDAVNTLLVEPKGFGGSDGFGVKNWEAVRTPLPQQCVVFVSSFSDLNAENKDDDADDGADSNIVYYDRSDGSGSVSRDRCLAAHLAGMRVIYVEDESLPCTAEDLSDGVVLSLGTEEDWEMVTLDDISSPGSFWLNTMQAKDEDGLTVDTMQVIQEYMIQREVEKEEEESKLSLEEDKNNENDEPDEDEIARILADMESL
jgi:hypothetical protein